MLFKFFKPRQTKYITLVGYVSETSACVFVYGDMPKIEDPSIKTEITKLDEYTFLLDINDLQPGTEYKFAIKVGKATRQIEFKTSSYDASDLSLLMGSCNLHSVGFISSPELPYKNINKIADKHNSELMIHMGDQIYSDIPIPFFLPTLSHYRRKYIDAWADCRSTNKLLSRISNIMILDDHEIINNYENRRDRWFYENGVIAYRIFQDSHNPDCVIDGVTYPMLMHYTFNRNGHPFFVMDSRCTRDIKTKIMISSMQETHLYNWLIENKDKGFKFIVTPSPFLLTSTDLKKDGWARPEFVEQRNRIMRFILDNEIHNVILLSGDVHCGGISNALLHNKETSKSVMIHEITSSPINQVQRGKVKSYKGFSTYDDGERNYFISLQKPLVRNSHIACVDIKANKIEYTFYRTKVDMDKNSIIKQGEIELK